jgi:DNA-binding Xre family transcriptional regulator
MLAERRQVRYLWRLREVMASRGLFSTTALIPLLVERGIELSAVQVWRLVTGTPERLSLPVLAALCDILEVTPSELIVTSASVEQIVPAERGRRWSEGPDSVRRR